MCIRRIAILLESYQTQHFFFIFKFVLTENRFRYWTVFILICILKYETTKAQIHLLCFSSMLQGFRNFLLIKNKSIASWWRFWGQDFFSKLMFFYIFAFNIFEKREPILILGFPR